MLFEQGNKAENVEQSVMLTLFSVALVTCKGYAIMVLEILFEI